MSWAEDDMTQGYMDGFDRDAPEPSDNRSRSYRHGFANARDDLRGKPRSTAQDLREIAQQCIDADMSVVIYG